MPSSFPTLLVCSCFVLILATASATDHIVGANKGWNPGINYTLWANNQTFYVGDLILNQTGYDNCTTEGAIGNWSSGKDFITLNDAKRYYFICGNGQCYNGMKVSVLVHPLPPPPSSSAAANGTSSNSAMSVILENQNLVLRAFVVAFASIWFNVGWI